MKLNHKRKSGFSLVELMIVIAIIGILAAIAVPAYNDYIKRSRLSEFLGAISNFKAVAEHSIQTEGTTADAVVADSISSPSDDISTVAVASNGVITITGEGSYLNGVTVTYTPTYSNGLVTWGCVVAGTDAKRYTPTGCTPSETTPV